MAEFFISLTIVSYFVYAANAITQGHLQALDNIRSTVSKT